MLDAKASLRLACCLAAFIGGVHSYSMENPCKYHSDAKCTEACKQFKKVPHGYCRGDHCECSTQARAVVESTPDPCRVQDTGACVVSCTGLSFDMGQCVEQICHCLNMNDVQPGTRLSDARAAASKQMGANAAVQPQHRIAPDGRGHPQQPQQELAKRVIGSSQETYVPLLDLICMTWTRVSKGRRSSAGWTAESCTTTEPLACSTFAGAASDGHEEMTVSDG
ncbi:uncharacterized protein LOC119402777 isoform X1 [Rhipicephalus sanguineus]|uniref:uncharacterized protein LOC119402777 isoform X1 n=1 Tax=Rhipicephalus sanguineus TaxID=34632 RepID=UPI001893A944|nr:uncharacterized protein LOC119402777 isoform X1 [Rhipicephalus sanguineus]